jgi:prepilin-type N-terminal cleavage/methylation domain-containing protein
MKTKRHSIPKCASLHGYTLIELMCSAAIVGILATMLFPVVQSALTRAEIAKTYTHLQMVRDGVELFAADQGKYPKGSTEPPTTFWTDYDATVVLEPLLGTYLPNNPEILVDYFSQKTVSEFKKSIRLDLSHLPNYIGYSYFDYQHFLVPPREPNRTFSLISIGPDGKDSGLGVVVIKPSVVRFALYSPSNGVISDGDIGIGSSSLGVPLR